MKVYAKQVPPEYQESPIYNEGCFPDNIAVCGNRDFNSYAPKIFYTVRTVLEYGQLADILEYPKDWLGWYKNATEAIMDNLPPKHGKKYSTNAIHVLRNLVIDDCFHSYGHENEILCKVLSIVTGKKWDFRVIRGCCQGEWQNCFYPVDDWSSEDLKRFEIEYFNTGTQWLVDDGKFCPDTDSPLYINGYSVYCTAWNLDGIKQEIANIAGTKPADVTLYAFDGYVKTPKYREVS